MASALLASRNEPYWGERKVYMRETPNPKLCPNPNPNFNQIPNGHETDENINFQPMDSDETAVPAAAAVSEDSSSFVRKPADLGHRRDSRGCVTFDISAYSKHELRELKRGLILELEQVRSVISRVESMEFQSSVHFGGREAPSDHPDVTQKLQAPLPLGPDLKKLHTAAMKKCTQILTKLMRHKGGVWFNTPVDVEGMCLHDYHLIIKKPMDLGTVKSKLANGLYLNPIDFASDIRLTFNNALVYNPPGHDVHRLAGVMLKLFEDSFGTAYDRYEKQRLAILRKEEEDRQRRLNCSRVAPVPEPVMRADPSAAQTPKPALPPHHQPTTEQYQQAAGRMPKQPKRNEGDPLKRVMSMEEKHRLSYAIQELPEDKMTEVLQIVSKRNETQRNGDEVEIDFELVDPETLWELDRYVANWNMMVSKARQQKQEAQVHSDAVNKSPVAGEARRMKKGEPVEEEIDIGDEMPANHYPPVEIRKAESSSCSSGSDSSSSSGSDSGSSSGSDSEDGARSPAGGSRRSPRS